MTVLHISASPRGSQSESRALAASFVEGLRATRPDAEVEEWDLWDGSVPAFGPVLAGAKMAIFAGQEFTAEQAAAWAAVERTFARFDAADEYVFSVPMWNAGVPYILKQLIDVVSQPGLVFSFDPERGYTGLLRNKRAVVAATSAVYGVGRPASFGSDFQTSFLEDWLRWAGITDITTLELRPNLAVADADQRRAEARLRAVEAGRAFGVTGVGGRKHVA
jgi:FMN-dependent NADH-azoreductase